MAGTAASRNGMARVACPDGPAKAGHYDRVVQEYDRLVQDQNLRLAIAAP
jgi:hypothetical protein